MPETPVAPATPGSTGAAAGQPKVPGARSDTDARIAELAAQKAHFQKKAAQFEAQQQQLREELASVKGQLAGSQPAPKPARSGNKSWTEMSDDELDQAKEYARANDAHQMLDAVYEERSRRQAESARKQAVEEASKNFERANLLRDIHQKILTDFGPEAFSDDSELKQVASAYLNQQAKLYGEATITPHKLYDAYSFAERQTKITGERQRLQELEQENRALREQASLAEHGGMAGSNARPLTDEVKEALKRGDKKSAIRGLSVFKDLRDSVKRSLLPPR